MKKALIVGHTGQDGTCLSTLLREKKYSVYGISRNSILQNEIFKPTATDIADFQAVSSLVSEIMPNEIYYLAAIHQSSSDKEFCSEREFIKESVKVNVTGLLCFLEALRKHAPSSKLFYAASSHIFGNVTTSPQNENTPVNPDCEYGITKASGMDFCRYYRNAHGIFASVGILYNHESPFRESKYVSKKIVETAVAIKQKQKTVLELGNLDAEIDWGFAPDYMDAAYRILQLDIPDNFIISSGERHSIREFTQGVFAYLDLPMEKCIRINPALITKKQKKNLFGDNKKIKDATGWMPSVDFKKLIKILVDAELKKHGSK